MSENKMLIDATHPEETRVVVLRGGRVEEFDYESAARKQLRGNIYLAKVTRVEPALQAAFVDYGGNRHGFLAFNEIHPDYYQIPIADRLALLEEEAAIEAEEEAEADARAERMAARRNRRQGQSEASNGDDEDHSLDDNDEPEDVHAGPVLVSDDDEDEDDWHEEDGDAGDSSVASDVTSAASADVAAEADATSDAASADEQSGTSGRGPRTIAIETPRDDVVSEERLSAVPANAEPQTGSIEQDASAPAEAAVEVCDDDHTDDEASASGDEVDVSSSVDVVEEVGEADALEELPVRPRRSRRSYKIQEVIKRRQVLLIQVVKEERGNKGAALTTYLSLAGRYTVLMPNTARGGGISRKITNPQDRKRLKAIAAELEVPEGMGLIIRTAGATRTKQEIRRDFEYLLRLWESVRELTLQSTAPSLVYEEGDLIKRSIRDLYNKDIDEIIVAGEEAHREAKSFMRMLMPSHAKNVTLYKESEPLFTRYGIERQLNAMFSPFVTLKSGGYLVINQTEALVAVDVNSGRSTREFSIEETALHTNLEAADEIARHLKLRDLAGLIVIDFIDMEEKRNNRAVERRLKEALRLDRARIQVGRISPFGLLEMSRQRLRTGVLEGSTSQCPHCQGTGIIRSTESIALAVLRALEDAVLNKSRGSLIANTTAEVALYILNHKRDFIIAMEERHGFPILVQASDKMAGANFTIEKGPAPALAPARRNDRSAIKMDWNFEDAEEIEEDEELVEAGATENDEASSEELASAEEATNPRRRRRRRRGRRNGERQAAGEPNGHDRETELYADADDDDDASHHEEDDSASDDVSDAAAAHGEANGEANGESERPTRRRRRGRRGGRRNRERNRSLEGASNENGEASYAIPGLGPQPLLSELAPETSNTSPEQGKPAQAPAPSTDPAPATLEDRQTSPQESTQQASDAAPAAAAKPAEQPAELPADPAARVSKPEGAPPAEAKPHVEPAEPAKVAETVKAAEPAKVPEPAKTVEPSEGPRLQRVIISPDTAVATEVPAVTGEKPVRRGWWQRKLMGSES